MVVAPTVHFEFLRSPQLDLAYHVFAHMDLGRNAASVYDSAYIREMNTLRRNYCRHQGIGGVADQLDLHNRLKGAAAVMAADQDMMMLFFVPFIATDVDDLLNGMNALAGKEHRALSNGIISVIETMRSRFSDEVKAAAVGEIAQALVNERPFYENYGTAQEKDWVAQYIVFAQFWNTRGAELLAPHLASQGISRVNIVLSETMRTNGRGFGGQSSEFTVAARLPENLSGQFSAFFTVAHEITHLFTDPLVAQAGHDLNKCSTAASSHEGYDIHQLVEGCAILGDLFLFSKDAEFHREYIAWLGKMGMRISAGSLESQSNNLQQSFALPDNLARAVLEKFLGE